MAAANDSHTVPTVHITGNGSIQRDATHAVVTLRVHAETRHRDDDPGAANSKSTDRVAHATTTLRRLIEPYVGGEVVSWKTTDLRMERTARWEPQPDRGPSDKFSVVMAQVTVTVVCQPVDGAYAGLNVIVRDAMAMRDVSLRGVAWDLDGVARRKAELEARAAAAADAKEQAEVYARAIWGKRPGEGIRCVRLEQPVHGAGVVRKQKAARAAESEVDDFGMLPGGLHANKPALHLEPEQTHFSVAVQTIWEVDS